MFLVFLLNLFGGNSWLDILLILSISTANVKEASLDGYNNDKD